MYKFWDNAYPPADGDDRVQDYANSGYIMLWNTSLQPQPLLSQLIHMSYRTHKTEAHSSELEVC